MMKALFFFVVFLVIHLTTGAAVFKKGRCPIMEESDLNCNRKYVSECLVDFDCNVNGTTKCCRTACHQYQCIEPINAWKKICQRLGNILFVLDASGSIEKEYFEKSKR
ncbi:hypothetical protein, partial [Salmonella sp. s51933]|uniref:hypothetical protein n=1 Tax=Salmonella sp. s51933 TaxID=3160127 RepID=UPI0037548D0E